MKKYLLLIALLFNFLHADDLGVDERLGTTVPLELTFTNEQGKSVTLKKLMNSKPTLLTLNYFECAGICTPQLTEMAKMLSKLHLAENIDYKVVTVDFAESESVKLANGKKETMIQSMSRAYVKDAWHFVIGENNSSGKLAEAVGFKYKKVLNEQGRTMGYLHGATIIVLSPTGKIVRYLKGVEQLEADVAMAIKEASQEKVSTSIPKDSPFCFTERPSGDILVNKVTKSWMIFMLMVVIGLFVYLLRKKKK
jgi:protein SCO1/2